MGIGDGAVLVDLSDAQQVRNCMPDDVLDVTLSLDTGQYADGDVLAATQEITNAFYRSGGTMEVLSVVVQDIDDQKGAFTLLFLSANVSYGTENSAAGISDANSAYIVGQVNVTADLYEDHGGMSVAAVRNVGLLLKAGSGTSLYVAAKSKDTKTYSAAGLKLKIGVRRN